MSWILDVIIVVIAALTIFFAFKNGFVKTAISAVSCIVAIILTVYFSAPLAEYLKETPISQSIETATEEKIADLLVVEGLNLESLVNGESEEFNRLVKISGIEKEQIVQWFNDTEASIEAAQRDLAKRLAAPIIDAITTIVAIFSIYVGTQVILAIISFVLDKIANLPSLKKYNQGFGVALGVVIALVRICLFCFVVKILIANADFLGSDIISALNPENTVIYKFISEVDIFSYIF